MSAEVVPKQPSENEVWSTQEAVLTVAFSFCFQTVRTFAHIFVLYFVLYCSNKKGYRAGYQIYGDFYVYRLHLYCCPALTSQSLRFIVTLCQHSLNSVQPHSRDSLHLLRCFLCWLASSETTSNAQIMSAPSPPIKQESHTQSNPGGLLPPE